MNESLAANADALGEFLVAAQRRAPVLLLTGAGISTASGIADYRDGAGQYKRPPPVTISEFLARPGARQRYWARSLFGWPAFRAAAPNAAHQALAVLEREGWSDALITQNVDGLHQRAGHSRVLELHGNLHTAHCIHCQHSVLRSELQQWLEASNPQLCALAAGPAPDGDADLQLTDFSGVAVPDCSRCGGILKPAVVFFGDSVDRQQVDRAYQWVAECGALLIVGSSVMIHSSFRFVRRARELGLPLAAVNMGHTRADDWLDLKLTTPCERLLPAVLERLVGTNARSDNQNG